MKPFQPPPGSCDTHAHVIAADRRRYPMVPERSYTPEPAPEADYLAMLDALGMHYGVLVQISVYGSNNRLLTEVLARHPERLRGVVVLDAEVSDRQLDELHFLGVRGVRINLAFAGGVATEVLDSLAPRLAERGWHVQLLFDLRELALHLPRLRRLPVPYVFDHMGYFPANLGVDLPVFQQFLALAQDYPWWVKLSAPYRLEAEAPWPHCSELVHAMSEQFPERLLWGSDWPHVAVATPPDTQSLLNVMPRWLPDARLRQQVLVENPARLYDFPST